MPKQTNRITTSYIITLFILLFSLGLCSARSVVYQISSFSTDEIPKKSYRITWDSDDIVIPRYALVEPPRIAELRDDTFLDFYDSSTKASAEGIPPKPEFSVKIPDSPSSQYFILLFYIKGKVKPILLDFNQLNCNLGQELVFNMLNIPIVTRFVDDNTGRKGADVQIRNGEKKVLPERIANRGLRKFFYQNPKTKKTVMFSSSLSFTNKNSRDITFIHPTYKAKLPAMSTISVPKISPAEFRALRNEQEQ